MQKYIDTDKLLKDLKLAHRAMTSDGWTARGVWALIERQPAADVAEVRHGHWVYKMRELIRYEDVTGTDPLGGIQTVTVKTHVRGAVPYCSLCDALAADSFLDYCPRCGAKMDGETKEET